MASSDSTSNVDSDLGEIFRRLIRTSGPISLTHFMGESNARYYASRDPFGENGDFITAPEISQMFGELIGLWMADIWLRAGGKTPVNYVELGPGRGTLTRDVLRSSKQYGFAPQVHFIEGSPTLRTVQGEAVPDAIWHDDLSTIPHDGPVLIIANEFLDALPIRQMVATASGWRERMVGLQGEELIPVAGTQPLDSIVPEEWRNAQSGTIIETCPAAASIMYEICSRLEAQGGAALIIDYGFREPRTGSSLQAIRNHQKVDPFAEPGAADITALVDFGALARIAEARDVRLLGTTTQGEWLSALGIDARTEALSVKAPQYASDLSAARDRLIAPDQMGTLFKVLGLASEDWPDGAGFPGADQSSAVSHSDGETRATEEH